MQDPITALVVSIFHTPGVALGMAAVILLFGLGLVGYSRFTEYKPLVEELRDRWNLLTSTRTSTARKTFFDQFGQIDIRFSGSASGSAAPASLVLGWANFRSLLVENDGNFATTVRASEAFDRLDESARSLEWWANILVAIGLVVTFLGIVAALSEATSAMSDAGGGDSSAMESALMGLLAIAATKFWTSIAGVLASIILRVVARYRRRHIESLEARFFEALDACVQFMPPEKVMVQQLQSLKRMEASLSHLAPKA